MPLVSTTETHVHLYTDGMLKNPAKNECTEVQNPRYKDVTLNAYISA